METNICNLPLIPDEPIIYVLAASFYECYDQLYKNEKFCKDIDDTMNIFFTSLTAWRSRNLILNYPGDMNGH